MLQIDSSALVTEVSPLTAAAISTAAGTEQVTVKQGPKGGL